MLSRLTTPSSATAEAGAPAARWRKGGGGSSGRDRRSGSLQRMVRRRSADFHFDELVWRDDTGFVDVGRTALTEIESDLAFEREVFLIRVARNAAGFSNGRLLNGKTRRLGERVQMLVAFLLGCFLLCLDSICRRGQLLIDLVYDVRCHFGRSDKKQPMKEGEF